MSFLLFLWFLILFSSALASAQSVEPFALRISCGANKDVYSEGTLWLKDFGYTGGYSYKGARLNLFNPALRTIRRFRCGSKNCYNIDKVPEGLHLLRIYYGWILNPTECFKGEPVFNISVQGTQIVSKQPPWLWQSDGFDEVLVYLTNQDRVSICIHCHRNNSFDPTIQALEIIQIDDDKSYDQGERGRGVMLKTLKRLDFCLIGDFTCTDEHWVRSRYWKLTYNFEEDWNYPQHPAIFTENSIHQTKQTPNFYPETIYKSALVSTKTQADLSYAMSVNPSFNHSFWFHFAEIDPSINGSRQRVFDILINGETIFEDVDIVKMTGDVNTALVLNYTTVASNHNGRNLAITIRPKNGSNAILNALEIFEIIPIITNIASTTSTPIGQAKSLSSKENNGSSSASTAMVWVE